MKKVLVTGATGFIGRQCLPFLAENGYEVHATSIDAVATQPSDGGITWHRTDLLDPPGVAELVAGVRPSHLLHFAWYAVPGKYWTSAENLRWVQASLDLLQAFTRAGGQRVVAAGTCAEYDWNYGYCSELVTPLAPTTLYGTCKHAVHLVLESYAAATELSAAWGRIFFLYGPGEHPDRLVASVIRALLRGEPARCSHGNQVRDFLHVEDVGSAFARLLDSDAHGAVNVGSGKPVSLRDVVYEVADLLGRRDLVRLGTIPASPSEPPLLVADVRRLRDDVGWRPRYDLHTGLSNAIEWWRSQAA